MSREPRSQSHETRSPQTCRQCGLFIHAPQELEQAVPGFNILSSAFGSVRGETGLCKASETFVAPMPACRAYRPAGMR